MSATSEVSTTSLNIDQSVESRDATASLRRQIAICFLVGAAGVAIAIAGFVAFLFRVKLAAAILGARVLFGLPVSEVDAGKVLAVTLGTFGVMGYGVLTVIVAGAIILISYVRNRPL